MYNRGTKISLVLLAVAACAGNQPPPMIGGPAANGKPIETQPADSTRLITPALGYSASGQLTRRDSIILTLPDGQLQIQQMSRRATLAISVSPTGLVRVRLDSIEFNPPVGKAVNLAAGTIWNGRLGSDGIERLRANRTSDLVDELTPMIQELLPAIPRSGVAPDGVWGDTTKTNRRVEIFAASDQRQSTWHVGESSEVEGLQVHPIKVLEHYQQLGEGSQAGREMRMSAEGVRKATYYMTLDGRVDQLVQVDSANRLITIPDSRQAVPTTQIVHLRVVFDYK